ncbi:MAG: 7-cyano-7-deazaguanine synthase, partial [Bacillota bacterium]|nr:7-cyano-7-deazaguanine synthase [Bacillota bacterium]
MKGKKVFVAMSGGVDSSIAAALLKEQGYKVIGVTMQIWQNDQPHQEVEGSCCSLSAVEDARRVAHQLDIPYYVMNFRDLFAEKVIEPFCQAYASGITPNPCIACNQFIKFEGFLQKVRALGGDYMATGHYAKIFFNQQLGRYSLAKAED